jgi:tRNA pseudouridine65 synthase
VSQLDAPPMTLPLLLHGDDHLVAFAKPSGLLVHRGWGDDAFTLVDHAREHFGDHIHPVHRLDRGTSGVIVIARSAEAAARIQASFERGEAEKCYLALVRGIPPEEGLIDHPIPRREDGPRVPAVTAFRRRFAVSAVTAPDLPAHVQRCALVEARPRTGRLHQVRRHLKHLNHPLLGDANYGKGDLNRLFRAEIGLGRLALHAASLEFVHPFTGARLRLEAPLPEDLALPFARLGIPAAAWA